MAVIGACHGHIHLLASFTDQGVRNVKETIGPRGNLQGNGQKERRCAVKDLYWTLGTYDVVASPDDESATALSLSVCSRGNVRSETLRAFSFEEMKRILAKMV